MMSYKDYWVIAFLITFATCIFIGVTKTKEINRLKKELAQTEEKLRPEITELSTLIEIRDILKSCKEEADRMIEKEKPND